MMSSGLAVAQPAMSDESRQSIPGEDIDYTREAIEVQQDLEEGRISLVLGEARMEIDFGDGRISLMTAQKKYMGIADVYDEKRGFDQRVGIPTYSIFHQKLIGIGEYVDSNENGLFDVEGPKVAGTLEELEDADVSHETLVKWIDFDDVTWELSSWSQTLNGNEVDIRFALSSQNNSYNSDHGVVRNLTLENLAYYFRVTTVEEEIRVDAVPHYRVFADGTAPAGDRIDSSELVAETNVTGHVLNSSWKYDQEISGWDIATDHDGNERNDTRLVVLTELAYGVHLDEDVGEWMGEQHRGLVSPQAIAGRAPRQLMDDHMGPEMMVGMGGSNEKPGHDLAGHPLECGLAYAQHPEQGGPKEQPAGRSMNDDGGSEESSDNAKPSNSTHDEERKEAVLDKMREYHDTACVQRGEIMDMSQESKPEAIRAGAIHFDDNGADIGRIRWVSNATVDGVETEVLFQINGARPVVSADLDGKEGLWAGVRLVGGYNYVLGESVYHDPEFSTDVLTIDSQSFGEPFVYGKGNIATLVSNLIKVMPLAIGIVTLGVIGIVLTATRSRRNQAPLPSQQQYVPAAAWNNDDDWSKYQP